MLITGVDHIAIIVRDFDRSVADFEQLLGRLPGWRGTLEGARHAWFQLQNAGIDIISPAGEGRFGNLAKERLAADGEGIWSIGLAVINLESARRTFERRGLAVSPATELKSLGEHGGHRGWLYANLSRSSSAGVPLFIVEAATETGPLSQAVSGEAGAVAGLDHIVVRTQNVDRAVALFGARLGLDLRLDRSNEQWGSRLLFFRCGDLVIEIGAPLREKANDGGDDRLGGLALRVPQARAAHERLSAARFDISELRNGRKPGTAVFTVRNRTANIPILILESETQSPA